MENKTSKPFIIRVKNASDEIQNVNFLNKEKDLLNHKYVHIYSIDKNISYEEILELFQDKEYCFGVMIVQAKSRESFDNGKIIWYVNNIKEDSLIRCELFFDPYQQLDTLIKTNLVEKEGIVNKDIFWNFNVKPNTFLDLILFPTEIKQNNH